MNKKSNCEQYIEEDQIDLRELWATLVKRKKFIGIVTGVITALAVAYVLLAKPIYEVMAVISLAEINHKTVDNPHDLKQKLDYIYEVNLKGKKKVYPIVSEVSLPKKSNGILVVKAQGYANKDATTKVNQVVDFVVKSENKDIMDYIDLQKKHILINLKNIHRLQKTIDKNKEQVSSYEKKVISLQKKDAALAAIYAIEVGKKEAELNQMQKTKSQLIKNNNALEYSISGVNLKNPKRVGNVQVLDHPVKPKKILIVAVAFMTGLMLSVFLAFFLEFIQGAKSKEE